MYHKNIGECPFRLPEIVASVVPINSMFFDKIVMCCFLVIWTPQGIGHPKNLWPDTLMLPIGFLNEILGACVQDHDQETDN